MEFNNPIVGEEELIRNAIKSQNYQPAPTRAGWRIAANGSAEFTDIVISSEGAGGTVTTDDGSISVYRASDGELIATMTPNGSGGFWSYDPDSPRTPFIAMTGDDLRFGEVDTNFNENAYINVSTGAGGTDPVGMDIASGNVGATVNSTSAHLYLEGTGDPSVKPVKVAVQSGDFSDDCEFSVFGRFVLGDTFNGTVVDQGKGVKDFQSITASAPLGSAEAIGINSDTITFEANRVYRITLHCHGLANTANDIVGFRLRTGSVAGNSLLDTLRTFTVPAANGHILCEVSQIVTPGAANLTTDIVATYYRVSGTGSVQMFANAPNPSWLEIRDIGVIADYPGAKTL